MIKRKIAGILGAATIISGITAFAQNPKVMIDNEYLQFTDAQPFIEQDRTLIPMRAVFEALSADVFWDEDTQTVIAQRTDDSGITIITLQAGSSNAFLKQPGQEVREIALEVPAKILEDRTYVPLRFVAESLGEEVLWDNDAYTVIINTVK